MRTSLRTLFFCLSIFVANFGFSQSPYTSVADGNWSADATWSGTGVPGAGDEVIIEHDVTIDDSRTINMVSYSFAGSPSLTIESGGTLSIEGSGAVWDNTGGFLQFGTLTVDLGGTISFGDGTNAVLTTGATSSNVTINGAFEMDAAPSNSNIIPAVTWGSSSSVLITGVGDATSKVIGNLDQSFNDFTWDCSGQSNFMNFQGEMTSVGGDFTVEDTGTGSIVFHGAEVSNFSLDITGDVIINDGGALLFTAAAATPATITIGGNLEWYNDANSTPSALTDGQDATVTVSGNVIINGGADNSFDFATTIVGGGPSSTLEVVGDFTHTSGLITVADGSADALVSFQGTSGDPSVFDNSAAASPTSADIDFIVPDDAYLEIEASSALTGTGLFTLATGGTLFVSGADGLDNSTGIVQTTTKDYQSQSNLVYNGTVAQVLGDGFPTGGNPVNLTIDNSSSTGVTNDLLSLSIAALGTLTLTDGSFNLGDQKTVTISGPITTTNGMFKGFYNGDDNNGTSTLIIDGLGSAAITGDIVFDATDNGDVLDELQIIRPISVPLGSDLTIEGLIGNSDGVLDLTGDLDIQNNTLTISGVYVDNGGGISSNGGTLQLNGEGDMGDAIGFSGTADFDAINVNRTSSGIVHLAGGAQVDGTLYMQNGEVDLDADLDIADGATVNRGTGFLSGADLNFLGTYNIVYSATNTTDKELISDVETGGTTAINDFTVQGGATVTLNKNIYINGDLTSSSSTLNAQTNRITFSGPTANNVSGPGLNLGNITIASDATVNHTSSNTISVSRTWLNQAPFGTGFNPGTGTINFNSDGSGGNPDPQDINPNGAAFNVVSFSNSGAVKSIGGDLVANSNFLINSGVTVDANSFNIEVGNTWQNVGTFLAGTGTVTFNGGAQSIDNTGDNFYNLVLSGSSTTKTLASATVILNDLTIGSGVTFSNGGGSTPITIGGAWINNGTGYTTGLTGTVTFNGTNSVSGSTATQFANVTISGTSFTAPTTMQVARNWDFQSGTFAHSSGTIEFNGNSAQAITPGTVTYNNWTMSGAGTKTLGANVDLDGNLDLDAGTFNATSRTINLAGNFDASGGGTFTSTGSTLILDGAGQVVTGGGQTFNNITLSGTGTDAGDLIVAGDWLGAGTFTNSGPVTFSGTGQTVNSTNGTFDGINITGSSLTFSGDVTNAGDWTSAGSFTAPSNVNFNGSGTISDAGASGFQALEFSSTADYALGSDISLTGDLINTSSTVPALDAAETYKVSFDGTSQDILGSGTNQFHDVDITGNAAVTMNGTSNITGTLQLVGGSSTFDADGSGAGVTTLVSSDDSPTMDGNVGALTTPANFTGNLTADRYISSGSSRWRYISSPVSGLFVSDWQGEFTVSGDFIGTDNGSGSIPGNATASLFYRDPAGDAWVAYPTLPTDMASASPIVPGIGYSAWIRDGEAPFTDNVISQTGPINSGSWDFTQAGQGNYQGPNGRYNLLGNPYPAALDWNALRDANSGGVQGVMVIPDNSAGIGMTQFRGYDAALNTTVNGGSKDIALGQAFWVVSNGSPSLTATESMKITAQGTGSFFKKETPFDFMRIALSDGTHTDETLLAFRVDAAEGMDEYDSYKVDNEIFNLSSVLEGANLVTNVYQTESCLRTVPLNIYYIGDPEDPDDNIVTPGSYSLSFTEFESFTSDVDIVLHDKFANETMNLSDGTVYTFDVTADGASYGMDRFDVSLDFGGFNMNVTAAGDESVCEGGAASVLVENTTTGVFYSLKNADGTQIGDAIEGNGSQISFLVAAEDLESGENILDIFGEKGTCGSQMLPASVTIERSTNNYEASVTSDVSCPESSVTLVASGAPSGATYQWYDADDVAIEGAVEAVYTTPVLSTSTDYFVSVVLGSNCEGVKTQTTAVISSTSLTIDAVGNTTCGSGTVTLVASGSPEGLYQWFDADGNAIDGATDAEYLADVSVTTSYGVQSLSSSGCSSEVATVSAEVSAIPEQPQITRNNNTLTAVGDYDSYQWYKVLEDESLEVVVGEKGSTLVVDLDGSQYVVEGGKNGCTTISEPLAVTSIDDIQWIDIYPNPVKEMLVLRFDQSQATELQIFITDLKGQIVYKDRLSRSASGYNLELNVQDYRNGVYFVKMTDGKEVFTGKFIKE